MLAVAVHGDLAMKTVPAGYATGTCHYDGAGARGYTLATDGDPRTADAARLAVAARYGEAIDVTSGDETVVTWSDVDRPRQPLARDGIRMIVLVRQGDVTRLHVSAMQAAPAARTHGE
jgi:hypothetical protein